MKVGSRRAGNSGRSHKPTAPRSTRAPATQTETQLVRACLDYLSLDGIFAWRANSGAITAEYKGKKRFFRFAGVKGLSDIIGILPDGRFLAIECKTIKGQLTVDQAIFIRMVNANDGLGLVVRSLDELASKIQQR